MLRELGSPSTGILGRILEFLKNKIQPSDFSAFNQLARRTTDLSFRLEQELKECFHGVDQFLVDQREGNPVSSYGQQERILPATRTLPLWSTVELAWETAKQTLNLLLGVSSEIHKALGTLETASQTELEDTLSDISGLHRRFSEISSFFDEFVNESDMKPDHIYWAEISSFNGHLSLHICPLTIGTLMENHLWHEKASVILTSATLTTSGSFDYLRQRLFADEADELALGSPFDYENAALLYLVNDISEPSDGANYQRAVEQTLIQLSKMTRGRLLALFTSYAQLKRTAQAITPALSTAGIQVYVQGEGASANMLLENFRAAAQAILLGTRAFWEGVDLPGEALSTLVIVKLPFDVPTDPIIAARAETFDDPFTEFSLPEAILRFRQGFGRLIRTHSDRGVVAVLDRRLLTKSYGKAFLDSIPDCTRNIGSMHDLPANAARWLNL
ncbi:MAG: helicase C-terminal domain-containing protein [Anaerolineaceae bacterium]|nr:helicase C-terminal domain-containing protein [Anaerolineaceae bacterium]